jgi:hypothetical protein
MPDLREEFIAFCESKGNERYDYNDINNCAMAQFGQSRHPTEEISGGSREYVIYNRNDHNQKEWIIVTDNHNDIHAIVKSTSFAELAGKLRANTRT